MARGQVYVGTQAGGFLSVGEPGADATTPLWPGRLGGPGNGGRGDGTTLPRLGAFHWQYPEEEVGETKRALVPAG